MLEHVLQNMNKYDNGLDKGKKKKCKYLNSSTSEITKLKENNNAPERDKNEFKSEVNVLISEEES